MRLICAVCVLPSIDLHAYKFVPNEVRQNVKVRKSYTNYNEHNEVAAKFRWPASFIHVQSLFAKSQNQLTEYFL